MYEKITVEGLTGVCLNRPDPWKIYESWARVASDRFGGRVAVDEVRDRETGELIPRRGPQDDEELLREYREYLKKEGRA